MKTLFAIDFSGSVSGCSLYHSELKNIINEYYKEGDAIYLWNSSIIQSDYNDIMSYINLMKGDQGTSFDLIANIANQAGINYREHLIIVTDGCVNTYPIALEDQKMQKYGISFKYVTTFVIGTGGSFQ